MANYTRNIGRLVADRYDFQDHIDGNPPHHKAGIITLDPSITIGGVVCTTVQGAITALEPFAVTVSDATEEIKGIIQLSGDLSGTATSIVASASKIQGYDVDHERPYNGDVLMYNGGRHTWVASPIPAQIVLPAGDLQGDGCSLYAPNVSSLTGIDGLITVKGYEIYFDTGQNPIITQFTDDVGLDMGATLTIKAQDSANYVGGSLCLASGISLYGGDRIGAGDILLKQGDNTKIHITSRFAEKNGIIEDTSNGGQAYVIALGKEISLADMPSETGSGVIYIANADTNPASGSPVGGTILYSSGGTLYIKQSDGRTAPVAFTAGGDIDANTSTYTNQKIGTLSGAQGTVGILCDWMFFNVEKTPLISQYGTYIGNGAEMTLRAQTSTIGIGGYLTLASGSGATKHGDLILKQYDETAIQITQPTVNHSVVSFFREIDDTYMPAGTGDKVIYISDTYTPPTSGSPISGTILYSSNGSLYIKTPEGVTNALANSLVYFDSVHADLPLIPGTPIFHTTGTGNWEWVEPEFEIDIDVSAIGVVQGDFIKVNFHGSIQHTLLALDCSVRLVIDYNNFGIPVDVLIPGTEIKITNEMGLYPQNLPVSIVGVIEIASLTLCSNIRVGVQLYCQAANIASLWQSAAMTVEVIRPQW